MPPSKSVAVAAVRTRSTLAPKLLPGQVDPGALDLRATELLSVNAACDRAGCSRRTLYNWMADAKVRWIRTAGGQRRVVASSLFGVDA